MKDIILLFVAAVLVNNFVLKYFLGICPFLGVSGKIESAVGMGFATTFVLTITAPVVWLINHFILKRLGVEFLQYVTFIIVIACLVQLVEMVVKKTAPHLYKMLGIYLPLITSNCAILFTAIFLVLREYSFLQSVVFGFGAGCGFTLALSIMAGIREELELADIPESVKGAGITLIVAGFLALAFMGFGGML
ncbi:MAG: electron transport complex subunit RsxA [Candidatus Omnitrophota bacterium]